MLAIVPLQSRGTLRVLGVALGINATPDVCPRNKPFRGRCSAAPARAKLTLLRHHTAVSVSHCVVSFVPCQDQPIMLRRVAAGRAETLFRVLLHPMSCISSSSCVYKAMLEPQILPVCYKWL